MYTKDWYILFDKTHQTFRWIFEEYGYMTEWEKLIKARDMERKVTMLLIMNKLWIELPKSRFNIKVNPPGWKAFLQILEEE